MKLNGLLKGLDYTIIKGNEEINVKNIVNDSRRVEEGSLFVCISGYETDGHKYVEDAIKNGAKAILIEKDIQKDIKEDVTIIKTSNMRKVLAKIANRYYNQPSDQFELIGITGTNGKTSTVFLIKNILEDYNKKVGIIGTIENRIGNKVLNASRTTPDAIELQNLFSKMVEANVNDVIMEVSSHALALHRVDYSSFDIGVFTNITLDHLDFHKTMDEYLKAKARLFNMCKIGIINIDDKYGQYMINNGSCEQFITIGCNNKNADINAYNIINDINGTKFNIKYNGEELLFETQTPGKFSVYNALCAIAVCLTLNVPTKIIQGALKNKSQIRGRFQTIKSQRGYYAIVDYAHTPDGLKNVLDTATDIAKGRIITVFGCGGDRDKTKRPIMGQIAGKESDYCIITSDNPRTEDPIKIIDDIEVGMKKTNCLYEKIVDRKEAIIKALSIAKEKDIILIAGKGHEDYQVLGKEKIHFDDLEVVNEYINNI